MRDYNTAEAVEEEVECTLYVKLNNLTWTWAS